MSEKSKCSYCGKSPPMFDTECVETGEKLSFCGLQCQRRWAYEKEKALQMPVISNAPDNPEDDAH